MEFPQTPYGSRRAVPTATIICVDVVKFNVVSLIKTLPLKLFVFGPIIEPPTVKLPAIYALLPTLRPPLFTINEPPPVDVASTLPKINTLLFTTALPDVNVRCTFMVPLNPIAPVTAYNVEPPI